MSEFSKFLSHFKNYFTIEVMTKLIGIASIPIVTHYLSPEDYGVVNIFSSYSAIFSVLFTLNCYSSLNRFLYDESKDKKIFIGTVLNLIFISVVFLFIVFLTFSRQISSFLDLPNIAFYYPFVITGEIFFTIYSQVRKAEEKSKNLKNVAIIKRFFSFLVMILLFLVFNNKLNAYLISLVMSSFLCGFFLLFLLRKSFTFSFNKSYIKDIMKYGVPLIPMSLSGVILHYADRIIINNLTGNYDAGLYSYAYNIGYIGNMILIAINSAFLPQYYKLVNTKNYKEHDNLISVFFRIFCFLILGLMSFGYEVGAILSPKSYNQSLSLVSVVAISFVFDFIVNTYSRNVYYTKKTWLSSFCVVFVSIINVILNYIFIPKYGYRIAAFTTVFSYAILALLFWYVSKFILKQHTFSIQKFIIPILYLLLAMFLLLNQNNIEVFWFLVKIGICLLGAFIFFIPYKNKIKRIMKDIFKNG